MTLENPETVEDFLAVGGEWTFRSVARRDLIEDVNVKIEHIIHDECGFHPEGARVWVKINPMRMSYFFNADVPGFLPFEFSFDPLIEGKAIDTSNPQYAYLITPASRIYCRFQLYPDFFAIQKLGQKEKNYLLALMISFARDFHKSAPLARISAENNAKERLSSDASPEEIKRNRLKIEGETIEEQVLNDPLYKWRLIKIKQVIISTHPRNILVEEHKKFEV